MTEFLISHEAATQHTSGGAVHQATVEASNEGNALRAFYAQFPDRKATAIGVRGEDNLGSKL